MAFEKESAVDVKSDGKRKALEAAQDTLRTADGSGENTIEAVAQFAEQSMTQFTRALDFSMRATEQVTKHATQNLDVMMQCGSIMAEGWQAIVHEWLSASQDAMKKSLDGFDALARCRTVDDLLSCQSEMVRDRLETLQSSSQRISEVSTQVASDTAKRIGDLSSSISFGPAQIDEVQENLRRASAEMARVSRS